MPLLDTGEYLFRLVSVPTPVRATLRQLYGDALRDEDDRPADFRVSLKKDSSLRYVLRPQINFYADCYSPFHPLPASQAHPMLEWGMNWCVAAYDFNRLIIHAAVIVKEGKACIFPASPGSGKSTLSAYLAIQGWDLYSDELAIIDLASGLVQPVFRPVCLKNDAIDIVRDWSPKCNVTAPTAETRKGTVAHLAVHNWQAFKALPAAEIVGVVYPRYDAATSPLCIESLTAVDAFQSLCQHAFNYNVLGLDGFKLLSRILDQAPAFSATYSQVADLERFLREEIFRE